jgi:hypothetical protein
MLQLIDNIMKKFHFIEQIIVIGKGQKIVKVIT